MLVEQDVLYFTLSLGVFLVPFMCFFHHILGLFAL